MSIAVAVAKYSPAVNPDRVILKLTFSGNYVLGGDTVNLNPASWSDPNDVGVIGNPLNPPSIDPSVYSTTYTGSSVGGSVAIVPGTTLATYKLQQFVPGGNAGVELSAGAYPAGILAGNCFIEMFI